MTKIQISLYKCYLYYCEISTCNPAAIILKYIVHLRLISNVNNTVLLTIFHYTLHFPFPYILPFTLSSTHSQVRLLSFFSFSTLLTICLLFLPPFSFPVVLKISPRLFPSTSLRFPRFVLE